MMIGYYNTKSMYTTIILGGRKYGKGVGIRNRYPITDPPVYSCKYNYIKNL